MLATASLDGSIRFFAVDVDIMSSTKYDVPSVSLPVCLSVCLSVSLISTRVMYHEYDR